MIKAFKNEGNNYELGLIGQGVEIAGQVLFKEQLHVDGKVTGKLISENGVLIVGEKGSIEAQIDVGVCVIHGAIQGDVSARAKIEIHKTGKVNGDLITPALIIEEGGVINGVVKVSQVSPAGQVSQAGQISREADSGKKSKAGA